MKKIILLLTVAVVLSIGCENPFWSNSGKNTPIEYTYDDEAETMAMWYYQVLQADDSQSQKIYNEMSLIDSTWKDSIIKWGSHLQTGVILGEISFTPYATPSRISFTFESSYLTQIIDSSYEDFYDALDSLGADSFYLEYYSWGGPYGRLLLSDIKNPFVASLLFKNMPAVHDFWFNGLIGGYSNIYPYFENGNRKYFYSHNWGDCPSGCMYSSIYYFEIQNDSAVLIDRYTNYNAPMFLPAWLDTLRMAQRKWSYNGWDDHKI